MQSDMQLPLTLFAIPKPFVGHNAIIQRNAITSWTLLNPRPGITLLGDDQGTAEIAKELRITHIPDVGKNKFGTPLVNSIFEIARTRHDTDWLAYINSDCILLDDFSRAVSSLKKELLRLNVSNFFLTSRRLEVYVDDPISFHDPDWQKKFREEKCDKGIFDFSTAIELFFFNRNLFDDIPPFAIGRTVWDNWLIWKAHQKKSLMIDASESFTVIHQNHDYSHAPGGRREVWKGVEAQQNRLLAADNRESMIQVCTHVLTLEGIKSGTTPERAFVEELIADKMKRCGYEFEKGNYAAALDYIDDAIDRCGTTKVESLFFIRAHCLLKLNKLEDAKEMLNMELLIWPRNREARHLLTQLENIIA